MDGITIALVAAGAPTLGALVLGALLWRETSRRADAQTALAQAALDRDIAQRDVANLRLLSKEQELRIQALETRLASVDPAAAFDSVFGVPSTPGSGDPQP